MAKSNANRVVEMPAPEAKLDGTEAKVEQLKQQSDIQKALKQTAGAKEIVAPTVEKKHKIFLLTYGLTLLILGVVYYILHLGVFRIADNVTAFLQRAASAPWR